VPTQHLHHHYSQQPQQDPSARPRSTTFHHSSQHLGSSARNGGNSQQKTRLTQAKSNSNIQARNNEVGQLNDSLTKAGGGGSGRKGSYYLGGVRGQQKLNASLTERSQDSPINEMIGQALKRPVLRIKRGTRGFGFTLRAVKVGGRGVIKQFEGNIIRYLIRFWKLEVGV
jgi:hypothetical protein